MKDLMRRWVAIVLFALFVGSAGVTGCALLTALLSGPEVTPADIYTIPPLERLYHHLDERYYDFQMMPAYGVTEDTKIYIGYAQGSGVYIAVFQIVDGAWEWIDTIEVEQEKGGLRSDKKSKSRRQSTDSQRAGPGASKNRGLPHF